MLISNSLSFIVALTVFIQISSTIATSATSFSQSFFNEDRVGHNFLGYQIQLLHKTNLIFQDIYNQISDIISPSNNENERNNRYSSLRNPVPAEEKDRTFENTVPEMEEENLNFDKRDNGPSGDCSGVGYKYSGNISYYSCSNGDSFYLEDFPFSNRVTCNQCSSSDVNCLGTCCAISYKNDYYCDCPIDRFGHTCDKVYKYTCKAILIDPDLPCTSPNELQFPRDVYSDPTCRLFGKDEFLNLVYQVKCASLSQYDFSNDNAIFSYFLKDKDLILTQSPNLRITLRVFNLKNVAVKTFSIDSNTLTAPQMIGNGNITFSLNLTSITSNSSMIKSYVHGNRIYFETGAFSRPGDLKFFQYDRRFIHFAQSDYPSAAAFFLNSESSQGWRFANLSIFQIILICLASLLFVFLIVKGYKKIQK